MSQIVQLLEQVKGVTFASIEYSTVIDTAAAHRHHHVTKYTRASVMLAGSVKDAAHIYARAVKKSAAKFNNDPTAVEQFTAQSSWHQHTPVYSIVEHKRTGKQYLYGIFNTRRVPQVDYFIDGAPATKEQVAELLTPSAARKLLTPPKSTVNKAFEIEHDVVVRTIDLDNIKVLKAKKTVIIN